MTAPAPPTPAALLFATDLSSRCDRALDRALLCARQWQARLVAMTVVEPGPHYPTSAAAALGGVAAQERDMALRHAEQRLHADLAIEGELPLSIRIGQGPVAAAILEACKSEGAGLIVTGVARNEALSRVVLGSTVDDLARHAPVPLLVVRNRARESYRQVLVASDFSPASALALRTAAALFPDAALTLFHAFDKPYPALAGMDPAVAQADGRRQAEEEARRFLHTSELPEAARARVRLLLSYGDASVLLHAHSLAHPGDLVVLGTQRRRGLLGLLLGSVAQRILEQTENDVLLIPPTATA